MSCVLDSRHEYVHVGHRKAMGTSHDAAVSDANSAFGEEGAARPVEAVASSAYTAEAEGYLSVRPGECFAAWLDQAEPGEHGCAWPHYVFVCDMVKPERKGWAPACLLWRRFVDQSGRPWLYQAATGDWRWEHPDAAPNSGGAPARLFLLQHGK